MGHSHSGGQVPARENNLLDARLAQSIQRLTRSSEYQPHSVSSTEKPPGVGGAAAKATVLLANLHPISFEKTILKSAQLNQGFSRAHSIYNGLQSKYNQITIQQVEEGAEAAGIHVDQEELAATASTGKSFDFRDFVVLLATEYINRLKEGKTQNADPAIAQTFDIALQSFLDFDKNHDGFFNRDEAVQTLREVDASAHARDNGVPRNSAIQARIAELDVDQDGMVSFTDYLAALETWVHED